MTSYIGKTFCILCWNNNLKRIFQEIPIIQIKLLHAQLAGSVTRLQSTHGLLPCVLCFVLLTVGHKYLDTVAPKRAIVVC